jgi:hypothetical protein
MSPLISTTLDSARKFVKKSEVRHIVAEILNAIARAKCGDLARFLCFGRGRWIKVLRKLEKSGD